MKIQLASDLHLEFVQSIFPDERVITPASEADVLILAGDISKDVHAMRAFADWPVPVLFVAGNHEFYDRKMEKVRAEMAGFPDQGVVRALEDQMVEIDGVRFLGTTLWTDYKLDATVAQGESMAYAADRLNDHRLIWLNSRRFMPYHALKLHEKSRSWLKAQLAQPFAGKTVVISHHAPHPLSVHSRYAGNPLNSAFASDLSELMEGVDLWVHGHVHSSFDYRVGSCRVVANARGYPLGGYAPSPAELEFENPEFNAELVLEV